MIIKKGAMFGLDARIALAIFGALSVISGASLYSAIQSANTVKIITQLEEVKKAVEQFMLDTGSYLPEQASNSNMMLANNLYENGNNLVGWNGPYIGFNAVGMNIYISNFLYKAASHEMYYMFMRHSNSSWGGPDATAVSFPTSCTSTNCKIYIANGWSSGMGPQLSGVFRALDEEIDGGDGAGDGKIRAIDNGTTYRIYMELMPEFIRLNR